MDFFADLKRIVEQHLTTLGVKFSSSADLETLMLLALNQELKTVSQRARKVHRSREFSAKKSQLDATQQQAAEEIIATFESGDDVSGHLSKGIVKADKIDPLLADWNIHHLHISNQKDRPTDKFYSRTGPVMFAHITKDAAYFIDIYPHGAAFPEAWTRRDLLKLIDENWPNILDPYRVKGITGVAFNPSDLELKDLREANVNITISTGSSFVAPPGGGLAADGTPIGNVERMDQTFFLIKDLEKYVEANLSRLKTEIATKSGVSERELDFELIALDPKGWGVIEKKTLTLVARTN